MDIGNRDSSYTTGSNLLAQSNNKHIYTNTGAGNDLDNYIYFHHVVNSAGGTGVLIVVPSFADSVTDTLPVSYASSSPIGRSAPIYSYSNSGPRTIQVAFTLHRDMMYQINYGVSNALVQPDNDDYVDLMVRYMQGAALPSYRATGKLVNPPLISVKLGSDIFIKGVVDGAVSVTYKYPVLTNGKYSNVDVAFSVKEVEPYGAEDAMIQGGYRGFTGDLGSRLIYVAGDPAAAKTHVNLNGVMTI